MKKYGLFILLLYQFSFAQVSYTQEQMYRKTAEAVAKFYGLDIIGNELSKRLQERYLPKEYRPYIPYIIFMHELTINKRLSYRREF